MVYDPPDVSSHSSFSAALCTCVQDAEIGDGATSVVVSLHFPRSCVLVCAGCRDWRRYHLSCRVGRRAAPRGREARRAEDPPADNRSRCATARKARRPGGAFLFLLVPVKKLHDSNCNYVVKKEWSGLSTLTDLTARVVHSHRLGSITSFSRRWRCADATMGVHLPREWYAFSCCGAGTLGVEEVESDGCRCFSTTPQSVRSCVTWGC